MNKNRTWTQLLGPFDMEGHIVVHGRFISHSLDGLRYRVLWSFQNAAAAQEAFDAWRLEQGSSHEG